MTIASNGDVTILDGRRLRNSTGNAYIYLESSGIVSPQSSATGQPTMRTIGPSGQSVAMLDNLPTINATNAVGQIILNRTRSSGTAATGFGARELFQLESSTTNDQDAGALDVLWTDATHASRTSAVVLSTVNNAGSLTERARVNFWGIKLSPVPFANLGTPDNGTVTFCDDCTIASPCASGGNGAIAKRLNGVWVCN
jgi:hypothetical protein